MHSIKCNHLKTTRKGRKQQPAFWKVLSYKVCFAKGMSYFCWVVFVKYTMYPVKEMSYFQGARSLTGDLQHVLAPQKHEQTLSKASAVKGAQSWARYRSNSCLLCKFWLIKKQKTAERAKKLVLVDGGFSLSDTHIKSPNKKICKHEGVILIV